jgi:hypothetical protein
VLEAELVQFKRIYADIALLKKVLKDVIDQTLM